MLPNCDHPKSYLALLLFSVTTAPFCILKCQTYMTVSTDLVA